MQLQAIYNIAALCYSKGLDQVVLCPGSRCAPLTLAFARHSGFTVRTFTDERSAGFIALGIAQQTKRPCILVCTSGTAVYNFAPAVAEAYFNHVPLIVFTADRPAEWIGQQDGQAIYQGEIFGKHVKRFYQLPQHYDHPHDQWSINRTVNEAINLAATGLPGPVHINAPFREPFYPAPDEPVHYDENIRVIEEAPCIQTLNEKVNAQVQEAWSSYHNILIVAGQADYDQELLQTLNDFSEQNHIPLVGDILTNLHPHENLIRHADAFLGQASADVKQSLKPDLLITFGKSIVSKNLKLFLRAYPPKAHWHLQTTGAVADSFHHLTKIIRTDPNTFFQFFASTKRSESFEGQKQQNFYKFWEIEERRAVRCIQDFFPQQQWGEFEVVYELVKALPGNANLHLANSMSVRYANLAGLSAQQSGIHVYSNRGTSGIDGCTSTAVGHALADENGMNILITGDEAFFYDRNAFWHNYSLPNLRVVLLNNHGGVIFKMIDGPRDLPESDEYFVTRQKLNATKLCEEFGFELLKLDSRRKLKNLLADFFEPGNTVKVLEIETDTSASRAIFDEFKNHIKKSYEL